MTDTRRFGKPDWLSLGFDQLKKHGLSGLTIEALCKAAGRTRGSFYHHFKDHDQFIGELMSGWQQKNTIDVALDTLNEPPSARRRKLSERANHLDHDLDRAVRQIAPSHPSASAAVREVDRHRTNFVTSLHRESGVDADLAIDIARLEYALFVGVQTVWPDMSATERMRLDKRFAWLLARAIQDSASQDPASTPPSRDTA